MRSCFESDAWIDRIVANPAREARLKVQNEKSNGKQHGKLGFATEAKNENPNIDFEKFRPSKSIPHPKRQRPNGQPASASPQSSQIIEWPQHDFQQDYDPVKLANGLPTMFHQQVQREPNENTASQTAIDAGPANYMYGTQKSFGGKQVMPSSHTTFFHQSQGGINNSMAPINQGGHHDSGLGHTPTYLPDTVNGFANIQDTIED